MPEINFLELVRIIREEAACLGHPMGKREATRHAGKAIRDEKFQQWCLEIDSKDVQRFGTITEHHSDSTARTAARRYLRAQFNNLERKAA